MKILILALLFSARGFCLDIKKVDEGVYRGPSPQTITDWIQLQELGIKYTLDLQTGAKILSDGSPLKEAIQADNFGIRVYAHPLSEILPPTQDQLDDAMKLITSKKPIYVHCHAGVDRTGIIIGRYRIEQMDWTVDAAVQEVKDQGMHKWYYWWLGVLR